MYALTARRCLTPLVLAALLLLAGCVGPRYGRPGRPLERCGDEIVVCGRLVHTGAPVVLWLDPGGYDAYRVECRFSPATRPSHPVSDDPVRYDSLRRHLPDELAAAVRAEGWSAPRLAEWVDQFVIHYDACGTSRRCFQVLQDLRGLSVHFMLDLDGTIYQTLDVKERAWHAGTANDRSVGVEIANIGAYEELDVLNKWYAHDRHGPYVTVPPELGPPGLRTAGFVARPARPEPVTGTINGRALRQYDLTEAQYRSLIKLTAALCRVLPKIRVEAPRGPDGRVRTDVLTKEELAAWSGLLGHCHVTREKIDPGPAFDWERVLKGVRRELR